MKDIQIVDIDYTASKAEYKKEDVVTVSKISTPWIIPEEGPFYGKSLRVLKGGLDLIPGTDFVAVSPVTDLTELTGKDVHLYVELKDHILASGGEVNVIYQRVGLPVISVKTLLSMLEDMVIKGKPIDWETQIEGIPDTFWPAWHSHDIQNPNELIGFGGLVELFSYMTWEQKKSGTRIAELLKELQDAVYNELTYIQRLTYAGISGHFRDYQNPHGMTPTDIGLGMVENYATATPQQDADGLRSDLLSTPAGLKRLIEQSAPEASAFVMQSEMPFGYYGSGIYLPPPITGSFEGLGSDFEDGCFVKEGNGQTVGLVRGYDGRVKNLYYIYTTDVLERSQEYAPWIHTYVQYQHPVITAAGKQANVIVSGSNDETMIIGDYQLNGDEITTSTASSWWVCATNSTFDPNSHTLKPINIPAIWGEYGGCRPGMLNLATVGDWIYVIKSTDSFSGDPNGPPANNNNGGVAVYNWGTFFYRFPKSHLTNPAITSITLTRVNCTFDNLERTRYNNAPGFFPARARFDASGRITSCFLSLVVPAILQQNHRKRVYIALGNPNNKRQARLRILMIQYTQWRTAQGNIEQRDSSTVVDYTWDVESNTLVLDPTWKMPTFTSSGEYPNLNQVEKDRLLGIYGLNQHCYNFNSQAGSWVRGVGWVGYGSVSIGSAPYYITVSQFNRTGNTDQDYESMNLTPNWQDTFKRYQSFGRRFLLKSPFGVTGFPRMYSDLYALKDGTRQTPIELFHADDETYGTTQFYRICETNPADNTYIQRPELQSKYIPYPIYGRKTNSNFGTVVGINHQVGMINRPQRTNDTSRSVGMINWIRRSVHVNPGAATSFSQKTYDDYSVNRIKEESDGSIIINLNYDYELDTLAKKLFAKPVNSKKLRIPRAIYNDLIYSYLGADANRLIDITVAFCLGPNPGQGSDQSWSMLSITYHTTNAPTQIRNITGYFSWNVASTGADGIRVMAMGPIDFPFTHASRPLRPGVTNNIIGTTETFFLGPNNEWSIGEASKNQITYQHQEILDYQQEGSGNQEIWYYPGLSYGVPGNAANLAIYFARRNNQVVTAFVDYYAAQAYNVEYSNQMQANPSLGMLRGTTPTISGGAMDLMEQYDRSRRFLVMLGATYVEGNWSVFVNAEVPVTFNGYTMVADMQNWDLRDLTDVYRNQTFYIYCLSMGSSAAYEITKTLRHHSAAAILVGVIKTDDFGIVSIVRNQSFTVSGFPLTRSRNMGVPVSSGAITEQGSYKFLKRSELYNG